MPIKDDESFIGRWSRRKRTGGVEGEHAPDAPAAKTAAPPADPEPEIDLATLPKIEEMTASSDFSVFLKKGVPDYLKRQALRHAWSIDPAIRDFVEVAENQWNFNDPNGVPGFGELPAGTDIKALLAQAIGERPKLETQADPTDAAEVRPKDGDAAPSAEAVSDSREPIPVDTVRVTAETAQPSDPDHMLVSAADGPLTEVPPPADRAGRRRHGGALPSAISDRNRDSVEAAHPRRSDP